MQSGLLEREATTVAKAKNEGTSLRLAKDVVRDAGLVVSYRANREKITISDYLSGLLRPLVEKDLEREKRLDDEARKSKKAK